MVRKAIEVHQNGELRLNHISTYAGGFWTWVYPAQVCIYTNMLNNLCPLEDFSFLQRDPEW